MLQIILSLFALFCKTVRKYNWNYAKLLYFVKGKRCSWHFHVLKDEVFYIQEGKGVISSNFGDLDINKGDYVVIPRGIIWNLLVKNDLRLLIIESKTAVETPNRYRNEFGQLLEPSPFCERDIKTPFLNEPIDKEGTYKINVRTIRGLQEMYYAHHPFDIIGWDGYYFPWVFNINDFEPIVGSIHQPPPVHQTFSSKSFVVCSFVSRLFDFHPKAIPAPYFA